MKAEYFSAVLEGALIIVAAAAIAFEAIQRMFDARALEALGAGLAVSVVASAGNGALAVHLVRRGREVRSPALEADGKHIGADVVTSLGVWLGVGLAWLTGWWILDPVLALLVAINVVWTGWQVVRSSIGGLMDEGLSPDELETVRATIRDNLSDAAIEVHDLRTRRAAAATFIEFHLVVPGAMTVAASHDLCDRLEEALSVAVPGARTQIHVEPEVEAEHRGLVAGPETEAGPLENP
jgi:cation diffusion facilitator family transporter